MQTRYRNPIIAVVAIAVAFVAFSWAADYADADTHSTTIEFTGEDFYIPRPADRSDQVGVERLLASVDVPAELQGLTCSVVGTSTNGESVHPNNFGMLRSNGDSVRIDGTEDTADGVKLSDKSIVLGATVQLFNVMLPDADDRVSTSVNYSVRVTCQTTPDDTTTTTAPPTSSSSTTPSTTTSSSTTTTLPPSTSSTTSIVTTTTAPTDSTTTTVPPSTSTTAPGSSTSTTAPVSSTTSSSLIEQDTTTTVPPTTDETLPFTGPPVEAAGIAMAAVALLVLGGAVLLMASREAKVAEGEA